MNADKAQYWGYTLNNYTQEELILIRQPPTGVMVMDHVHELEEAPTTGTPHVQGFAKLTRQVRKSFLIKHWLPRATWIPLRSEEYRENMRKYVQKQDATATSAVRQQTNHQPLLFPAMIPEMIIRWVRDNTTEHMADSEPETRNYRWIRDDNDRYVGERFEQWLWEHRRDYRHLGYTNTPWGELSYSWKGHEFTPHNEAPRELLLDFARSQLVRTHRVETLVDRPDVRHATERYATEILWRIEHTHDADPTSVPEEADEQAPSPPGDAPDPPSPEG